MTVRFIRVIIAIIVKYLLPERVSRYQRVFTVGHVWRDQLCIPT